MQQWRGLAITVTLVGTVALLYGQTARHEFVILDDPTYVSENPAVARGLSVEGVRWAFTTFRGAHWHPLTWLSHMLDTTLFGPGPAAPHLTNAALHAGSSALLFLALRSMTGAVWPSVLVAALFAVHPLRVESVAWASERKDVLSGFFWMLTLLTYTWYARHPTLARYAAVILCFALGLLAKPMLVTLPLVLLLLDVWPLRRIAIGGFGSRVPGPGLSPASAPRRRAQTNPRLGTQDPGPAPHERGVAQVTLEKLPLLALAAVASVMTVRASHVGLALQSTEALSPTWRAVNTVMAYGTYLRKTLWPHDLAVFYPHPGLIRPAPVVADVAWAVAAAAVLLAATTVAGLNVARRPYLAVGWLWYVGTLVPVIGLVQVGEVALADRYAYIPTVGLYLALAWTLTDLTARAPGMQRALTAGTVAVVVALASVTWFQVRTWRDSMTLFSHAVEVTRDNYFALSSVGNLLRNQKRLPEAAAAFEQALRIKPDFAFAQTNYGVVLERQGRLEEAAAHHLRALELDEASAKAHANLGLVRFKQDRLDEAVDHLERALQLDPEAVAAHSNLAAALLKGGNTSAAVPHLTFVLERDPANAETHNNLGVALVRLGRLGDALPHFEAALRINPASANAQKGRDYVRARLGNSPP